MFTRTEEDMPIINYRVVECRGRKQAESSPAHTEFSSFEITELAENLPAEFYWMAPIQKRIEAAHQLKVRACGGGYDRGYNHER